jgi:hypothetical protein
MSVGELIELLSQFPGELRVVKASGHSNFVDLSPDQISERRVVSSHNAVGHDIFQDAPERAADTRQVVVISWLTRVPPWTDEQICCQ